MKMSKNDFAGKISEDRITAAKKVLADNGIDVDETEIVLQALGYVLLDTELFPEENERQTGKYVAVIDAFAVRDTQFCRDLPGAEVFIGIYTGKYEEVLFQAARDYDVAMENIKLIEV